jgi:hypothetical protein
LPLWILKDNAKLPVKAAAQRIGREWLTNGVPKKQEKLAVRADKIPAVVVAVAVPTEVKTATTQKANVKKILISTTW